jgi:hypothetical protein
MWTVLPLALALFVGLGAVLLVLEGVRTLQVLYEQGGEQHWRRLADRLHMLDGQRDGVWLHVSAEGPWMVVRGRIEAPMPAGLRILRRESALHVERALHTGNPIADAHLHVEGDPFAARLLCRAELVATMMAVVHADPGSVIEERYVVLRYPDALGRELEGRCARVVELIHALRQASNELPSPQQIIALSTLHPR